MTTPSNAAMRAALAIKAKYGGVAIGIADDARIIDEATGLPALIAACRAFSSAPFDRYGRWTNEEKVALKQLRAAIAAAEETP